MTTTVPTTADAPVGDSPTRAAQRAAPGHRSGAAAAPMRLVVESPVGPLLLAGDADALSHLLLPGAAVAVAPTRRAAGAVREAARQLDQYFAGRRREFDVALAPAGTPFRLAVWEALRTIPYGRTISYAELARRAGRPGAFRAVGQANGANPLAIVVPCHRVVAADGGLGGYGGGLAIKQQLLAIEQRG